MKSQKRLQTSSQKLTTHALNSEEKAADKSRNQNKSFVQGSNTTNQTPMKLRQNEKKDSSSPLIANNTATIDNNKGKDHVGYSSAIQGGQNNNNKQYSTINLDNKSKQAGNSSPLKSSFKNGKMSQQNDQLYNSTLTAVQINQQQIQIEQQINSINDQSMAEQVVRNEKIRVAVRVRPFVLKEIAKESVCYVSKNGKQIRVSDLTHTVEGMYDRVFPKESSQSDAYSFVSDCIPNLLQGFNCTIFAYGQTGSGKTHTMFGDGFDTAFGAGKNSQPQAGSIDDLPRLRQSSQINPLTDLSTIDNTPALSSRLGIIPRCISDLFQQIKKQNLKMTIYCSFLQIYNEKLYDLLQDTYTKNPLQIREEKMQGIYVEGLSEYVVQEENDCMNLLKRGEKNRIKRATKMNIKSSRSHTLFQLLLETDRVDGKGMLKRAKLNLGDLAGSEKINKDEEMKAKHMLELRNINLSLTTLGKVIQILSQGSGSGAPPHVPFRESKLTRLLQDSIGGNCQTYLIATVSPLMESIEETISTLKFADRAKCVMQRVKKNEINAKDDALIQKLQKEVQHLKELLQLKRKGMNPNDLSHQLYMLKDENERLKQMAADTWKINYEDVEKMKEENKLMRLELQRLRMMASEAGSQYNNGFGGFGDASPRSFVGTKQMIGVNVGASAEENNDDNQWHDQDRTNNSNLSNSKKGSSTQSNDQKGSFKEAYNYDKLSGSNEDDDDDGNESIQEQFKNYKSELNFEINLTNKKSNNTHLNQTDLNTDRGNNKMQSINALNTQSISQDTFQLLSNSKDTQNQKQKDSYALRGQKERLNQVISEHQAQRNYDPVSTSLNASPIKSHHKPQFILKKRYKEGDLSDDYDNGNANITLPAIHDAQISLQPTHMGYNRVDLTRKTSNQDLSKGVNVSHSFINQSPYSIQNHGQRIASQNPHLTKSTDMSYHSDFNKHPVNQTQISTSIPKYPNQHRQVSNIRRSLHEFPPQSQQNGNTSSIQDHPSLNHNSRSTNYHQLKSQGGVGMVVAGMTTQSSLYGVQSTTIQSSYGGGDLNRQDKSRDKSPLQTVVRIRGRHNQMVETRGNILMTMDEEKKIMEKKKQLRRSNDRLRMLENMERTRQEKIEQELEKLMNEKHQKEQEELRRREILKQRKYVNANIGLNSQNEASFSAEKQSKLPTNLYI